jgi:hypothetical protein
VKDRNFLLWLHDRLERVHGEDPDVDYMHKLRAITASIAPNRETPNWASASPLSGFVLPMPKPDMGGVVNFICSSCQVLQPVRFDRLDETWGAMIATVRANGWSVDVDGAVVRSATCPACVAAPAKDVP